MCQQLEQGTEGSQGLASLGSQQGRYKNEDHAGAARSQSIVIF